MLSRLVITFLPRSKHLLISRLQSPCSDLGAEESKAYHCFHCFPIYLPWSDGTRCHDFHFLNVKFQARFLLSSFTFIKRPFSSSSLSAIRVVSSALSEVVDISPDSLDSSLCFIQPRVSHDVLCIKLKKQGDNIQPWCIPFPIWNQSVVPCPDLTVAS